MVIIPNLTVLSCSENECLYHYIQQPSSQMDCNPWPYMYYYAGNDLVLHCDVLGPQNSDILNVAWYREFYSDGHSWVQRIYSSGSAYSYFEKFSTPRSSGDISHGFKRINFTLFVNNVSTSDMGCYWCEIVVHSQNCLFYLRKSSVFCLESWSRYRNKESCSTLAINSSVVCAANRTCDTLPANWIGDPYLVVDDNLSNFNGQDLSEQIPTPSGSTLEYVQSQLLTSSDVKTTSIINSNSITLPRPTQTVMTSKMGSSISYPAMWSKGEFAPKSTAISSTVLTSHILNQRLPVIVKSSDPSSMISSALTERTAADLKQLTLPSSTVKPLERNKLANGTLEQEIDLSPVQIGIFIGIGACAILFAVISMLVFGVVMLCRKTEQGRPSSNSRHGGKFIATGLQLNHCM